MGSPLPPARQCLEALKHESHKQANQSSRPIKPGLPVIALGAQFVGQTLKNIASGMSLDHNYGRQAQMKSAFLAALLVTTAASFAQAEQKRDIMGFGLGMTADQILEAAPKDCWDEQVVYFFCDKGSIMVLYAPGGAAWTITHATDWSGPLDKVARDLGAEYGVELKPGDLPDTYFGSGREIRAMLVRKGGDMRFTITDIALAELNNAAPHADHSHEAME
jgi:hypothetical protein